jgi:hypothetical protein
MYCFGAEAARRRITLKEPEVLSDATPATILVLELFFERYEIMKQFEGYLVQTNHNNLNHTGQISFNICSNLFWLTIYTGMSRSRIKMIYLAPQH